LGSSAPKNRQIAGNEPMSLTASTVTVTGKEQVVAGTTSSPATDTSDKKAFIRAATEECR
jgi:hypothetical protein